MATAPKRSYRAILPCDVAPYDLWAEIIEKRNVGLAIVVGAMCIAIGLMVSAAVYG